METDLQQRTVRFLWQLRAAWAIGEAVSIRYETSPIEVEQRIGYVEHVAATGEYVLLLESRRLADDPLHIPLRVIVSVTDLDHFHEDQRLPRRPRHTEDVDPGQLSLVEVPEVSPRATRLVARAAAEMLSPDVIATLAAIDRAGRRPTVEDVARETGFSERWTAKRLRTLEDGGYVQRARRYGKRDIFLLG